MGNVGSTPRVSSIPDILLDQISKYRAGDIDEFIRIAEMGKHFDYLKEFRAWKVACLYYYMINMPEYLHDLGYTQPMIISEFQDWQKDTTVKSWIDIAMGTMPEIVVK